VLAILCCVAQKAASAAQSFITEFLEVIANLKYGRGKIFVQIPYLAPTLIQESIFPHLARPKIYSLWFTPNTPERIQDVQQSDTLLSIIFYSTVTKLPALWYCTWSNNSTQKTF